MFVCMRTCVCGKTADSWRPEFRHLPSLGNSRTWGGLEAWSRPQSGSTVWGAACLVHPRASLHQRQQGHVAVVPVGWVGFLSLLDLGRGLVLLRVPCGFLQGWFE